LNADFNRRIPTAHYIAFFVIAAAGCATDLLTKHFIFQWRGLPPPGREDVWWLWKPFVGIQTALNPGALFGIGEGMRPVFITASIIAFIGILYLAFGRPRTARDLAHAIPLAMILGGILGNLYDRLGLWHPPGRPDVTIPYVRDWILLRYGRYTWPNFNIADSLLVCGVGWLLWHAFRTPAPTAPKPVPEPPAADSK
jgi:signal peptidase II